jgi:hypothetical protein
MYRCCFCSALCMPHASVSLLNLVGRTQEADKQTGSVESISAVIVF